MTDKAKQIRLEEPDENGVAVVWIDMPDSKVNVLNTETLPEFNALMEEVRSNNSIKAVVIASGKANNFIAGADISMLNTVTTVEEGVALSQQGQKAMMSGAFQYRLSLQSMAIVWGVVWNLLWLVRLVLPQIVPRPRWLARSDARIITGQVEQSST